MTRSAPVTVQLTLAGRRRARAPWPSLAEDSATQLGQVEISALAGITSFVQSSPCSGTRSSHACSRCPTAAPVKRGRRLPRA
ncbi:MAG: hypothetical protein LC777_21750, partial [Actinobacteria bacterium]|nr:hypothetical protein [Actinomycetota bacterium]